MKDMFACAQVEEFVVLVLCHDLHSFEVIIGNISNSWLA
jgi:hypothetical protein